jgi:hypothetical protein
MAGHVKSKLARKIKHPIFVANDSMAYLLDEDFRD